MAGDRTPRRALDAAPLLAQSRTDCREELARPLWMSRRGRPVAACRTGLAGRGNGAGDQPPALLQRAGGQAQGAAETAPASPWAGTDLGASSGSRPAEPRRPKLSSPDTYLLYKWRRLGLYGSRQGGPPGGGLDERAGAIPSR